MVLSTQTVNVSAPEKESKGQKEKKRTLAFFRCFFRHLQKQPPPSLNPSTNPQPIPHHPSSVKQQFFPLNIDRSRNPLIPDVYPTTQVLRYTALGLGVFYGFTHQRKLSAQAKIRQAENEYHHKEALIMQAKAEWAKKNAPKTTSADCMHPSISFFC